MLCSIRRKKKAEEVAGINLRNTLGLPGFDNLDTEDDVSVSVFGAPSPRRSPRTTPRTAPTRRKSFAGNKSNVSTDAPIPTTPKERKSLAPRHKQSSQMDVAKAMGIMGFNSSRWLDASQVGLC